MPHYVMIKNGQRTGLLAGPFEVDANGCPLVAPNGASARYAPAAPCRFCPSHHPAGGVEPFAWCQQMGTCAATIDWERIYGRW